jgi:hypothetical protein
MTRNKKKSQQEYQDEGAIFVLFHRLLHAVKLTVFINQDPEMCAKIL